MPRYYYTLGPIFVITSLAMVASIYWPTFRELLELGVGAGGITHRVLVVPIFIGCVWRLRYDLTITAIKPFWPGLFALATAGAFWLVSDLALIRLFTEAAVIFMVPLVVVTTFGFRWLWVLSFPLFYLLFAIPIEGPLVDMQVALTAKFAHWGLIVTGIPVHREGPYFELPSGKWSIASACSGIQYLSACLMLTFLYGWILFSSTRKRIAFILGALAVGICGNWFRAYLTIAIAHLSDNRFLRHGHGTFGWVLFAAILTSYCLLGWRYRDLEAAPVKTGIPEHDAATRRNTPWKSKAHLAKVATAAAVFAVVAIWPLIGQSFKRDAPSRPTNIVDLAPVAGWRRIESGPTEWTPTLLNPTIQRVQSFEKDGQRVDLFIGVFANQSWTSKLVSSVNQFIAAESDRWSLASHGKSQMSYGNLTVQVNSGVITGAGGRIVAFQWYWIDGMATSNDLKAKIEQLRARLAAKNDVSAWITVFTRVDSSDENALRRLNEFMRDMGTAVDHSLAAVVS